MKKFSQKNMWSAVLGVSLLTASSVSFAVAYGKAVPEMEFQEQQQPPQPQRGVPKTEKVQNHPLYILKNNDLESSLPKNTLEWLEVIKKNNPELSCPQSNSAASCVFVSHVQLDSINGEYQISIKGTSFIDGYIKLPYFLKIASQSNNSKIWFKKALVNAKEAEVVQKNEDMMISTSKGDFEIKITLSKESSRELSTIKFANTPLVLVNNISNKKFIKDGDSIRQIEEVVANDTKEQTDVTKDIKQEELEINVFRKIKMQIPNVLTTKIKIIYSGQPKDFNLGKVLPEGFEFNSARSALRIDKKEDGFWVKLVAGEHEVAIESFLLKDINQFNVKNLISSADNEVWSLEQVNSIRQVESFGTQQIDPTQAKVPQEWKGFPAYLVKDNFNIKTNRRGIQENNNVSISIARNSYFGLNDSKMTHLDNMQINNYGLQLLTKNGKDITVENFNINNQNQVLVESGKNEGVIIPKGNFSANSQSFSEGSEFKTQFWEGDSKIRSWVVNLAPRMKMFAAFGDSIKTTNTWWDHWNLYTIFSVFLIVLSFYKLFGKTTAGMALLGLLMFQTEVFSWSLWLTILFTLGLLKVLPNSSDSKFAKMVNNLGLAAFSLFVLYTLDFIRVETQLIINPSLELQKLSLINHHSFVGHLVLLTIIFMLLFSTKKKEEEKVKKEKRTWSQLLVYGSLAIFIISLPSILQTARDSVMGTGTSNVTIDSGGLRSIDDGESAGLGNLTSNLRGNGGSFLQKNMPMPASAPMTLEALKEEQDAEPAAKAFNKSEIETIILKKAQVGSGVPQWTWNNPQNQYYISQAGAITKDSKISFWIAPIWLVNIFTIFQIAFLLVTLLVFGIGLIHLSNREDWFNRLPAKLKNCKFIQKLLINDLQKGFLK